jgi:hypothetical protein
MHGIILTHKLSVTDTEDKELKISYLCSSVVSELYICLTLHVIMMKFGKYNIGPYWTRRFPLHISLNTFSLLLGSPVHSIFNHKTIQECKI